MTFWRTCLAVEQDCLERIGDEILPDHLRIRSSGEFPSERIGEVPQRPPGDDRIVEGDAKADEADNAADPGEFAPHEVAEGSDSAQTRVCAQDRFRHEDRNRPEQICDDQSNEECPSAPLADDAGKRQRLPVPTAIPIAAAIKVKRFEKNSPVRTAMMSLPPVRNISGRESRTVPTATIPKETAPTPVSALVSLLSMNSQGQREGVRTMKLGESLRTPPSRRLSDTPEQETVLHTVSVASSGLGAPAVASCGL